MSNDEDNFDDIDLDELFDDFNDKPSRPPLANCDVNPVVNSDDLTEFNESDCTAPRTVRKRPKLKAKKSKQTTMYDYVSSVSYRHKQFYSSLDNTTTSKTIIKGQKRRSFTDDQQSSPISKRSKRDDDENLPSLTPPDLVDYLMKYLDERSRTTREDPPKKEEPLKKTKKIILEF